MTNLTRTLAAVLLVSPLSLSAQDAAEGATDVEGMTCAAFLEQDDAGRTETVEVLATAAGMDADATDVAARLGAMVTYCEADPALAAADAYQNAMDEPR